jgi:uncharacterized membrane protein (Fun14 family)
MMKISIVQQAPNGCLDIINVLKFIIRSNAGFADVLFVVLNLHILRGPSSELPVDDFLFSAGVGFLFGAVAGYAIKKIMKIAAVVVGLFVAALAYLSYRGWVDVKWVAMEDASRSTLTNVSEQVVHTLNNTAKQFAAHPSTLAASASGLPIAAMFGFVPGLMMGFKKG